MFEEKLKEKYYEACAWIDCLNRMPATEAKKQHALGYKAALEWAMEQYDERFDPPMSDEEMEK